MFRNVEDTLEQHILIISFNRFFGDDGHHEVPEQQLLPARKIREIELIYLDPYRKVYMEETSNEMRFSEGTTVLEISVASVEISQRGKNPGETSVIFLASTRKGHSIRIRFLRSQCCLLMYAMWKITNPLPGHRRTGICGYCCVLQEYFAGVRLEDEYHPDLFITLRPPWI